MAGSVGKKAAALVVSNPDKKRLAEKSFTSYVRAVQLMPNKQVGSTVKTYREIQITVLSSVKCGGIWLLTGGGGLVHVILSKRRWPTPQTRPHHPVTPGP